MGERTRTTEDKNQPTIPRYFTRTTAVYQHEKKVVTYRYPHFHTLFRISNIVSRIKLCTEYNLHYEFQSYVCTSTLQNTVCGKKLKEIVSQDKHKINIFLFEGPKNQFSFFVCALMVFTILGFHFVEKI